MLKGDVPLKTYNEQAAIFFAVLTSDPLLNNLVIIGKSGH